jgi:hypothetical protein
LPVLSALFAVPLVGEWPSRSDWLGIVRSSAGVCPHGCPNSADVCLFLALIGSMPTIWDRPLFKCLNADLIGLQARGGKGCAMAYCITLQSRTVGRITGWYTGSNGRWSTDHKRRKVFGNKHDARAVCHELRSACLRNAKVFKIEIAQDDDHSVDLVAADALSSASQK